MPPRSTEKVPGTIFSPSDLVNYFYSPYISWVQHYNLLVPREQRIEKVKDVGMEFLARKGDEFEVLQFAQLKAELSTIGGTVVEINKDLPFEECYQTTIKAMQDGADLIFQGALKLNGPPPIIQGYTDFLKKVPGRPSKLGSHSYEIYDTKLSQTAKPAHAIQLNAYNEMLADIQGEWPTRWHLILGSGITQSFLTSDFRYYYLHFKAAFLKFHQEFDISQPPTPESWESVIGYEDHIQQKLKSMDHLCTIAGMMGSQIRTLNNAGIKTRAQLATISDDQRPKLMQPHIFERLKEQAALQIESENKNQLVYKVLPHNTKEHRGLSRLPESDEHDVMFDMEGDPFAEGGLEYLFGIYYKENGEWTYKDWRATEPAQEKTAFNGFMSWIIAHYKKHPRMHVYHYANYERAAISSLSNKYSCQIAEVDTLLANEVFVDLYKVVKEGVRIGAPSYSIKKLEPLYNFKRASAVTNAGDSVVQFNSYSALKHTDPHAAEKVFADIVEYNKEDVVSTLGLLEWLREQKLNSKIPYVKPAEIQEEIRDGKEWEKIADDLTSNPPAWLENDEQRRVNEVVAGMSGYFQREDRPVYWNFYNRQDSMPEELYADAECLAVATVKNQEPNSATLSFDPDQPLKLKEGAEMCLHGIKNPFPQIRIASLDLVQGYAEITFAKSLRLPKEVTLIPGGPIPTGTQKKLLQDMAERWRRKGGGALTRAARDLLCRRPARIKGAKPGEELYPASEKALDAALRLAEGLDSSCLSIQGPPGTGKTFTGAHIICDLMRARKRVAVVAQGKKTIENLLLAVVQRWKELGFKEPCPAILMADSKAGGDDAHPEFKYANNSSARKTHREYQLVGGTHWLFAHPDMANQSFDYLFIDEAGQYSLTAAIACSFAAHNMIFLGDQMQLEQVNVVDSHPAGCGLSVLNYYMNGLSTVPRTHGVFLDETWRMHPSICGYISELIYENRLSAHQRTGLHALELPGSMQAMLSDCGILFLNVDHEGNSMRSEEEALCIEELVAALKNTKVPAEDGSMRAFTGGEEDLIVITPYNAQVELIRSKLPDVKVGSVDLFQGQEAWVSVLSMCASGDEGLHRGLDFLLSKNRMNVGLSRAKALSIVVGSPRLLTIRPTKIGTIPLLNFYAGLVGARAR